MTVTCEQQHKFTLYLRDFLKNYVWKDGMAIIHDALSYGTSLPFVEFCLQLRVGRTTRHSIKKLARDMKNGTSRWPTIFAKQLFNIWTSMHTRAAPYICHPVEHELHGSHQKRRILRNGACKKAGRNHYPERASEAAAAVWTACENQDTCVWIDNFAKRRKVPNPLDEDVNIDCTAFAVLWTIQLLHFDGHCTLAQLVHRVNLCIWHLEETHNELTPVLQNISDGTVNSKDMRIPLDVCRPKAYPPKWRPLLLTSHRTSSTKELVAIVRTLCETQAHTRRDLPVCCDMKVHLQLLRVLYSVTYERYHMHQLMFSLPLHYGIWYPYKYYAILIWRKFYPLLNCLLRADLKIGDEVVCHGKLVYME